MIDPLGALERTPRGLGRMISGSTNATNRRAGSDYRRQLAARVGCDPETSNPVLKGMLDEMAAKQEVAELAAGAVLDAALPGMDILTSTAEIAEQVRDKPPSAINDGIEKELARMRVDKYVRRRFRGDPNYTTTQRLLYLSYLRELSEIPGAADLVQETIEAAQPSEALAVIHEMKMLTALHRHKTILSLEYVGLPLAMLKDGTPVVVCAADYVIRTQEVDDTIAEFRKEYPALRVLSGRASAAAKAVCADAGIRVVEDGNPDF